VPPKRWLTFNGLHGVMTELFITIAVRTPDPTLFCIFLILFNFSMKSTVYVNSCRSKETHVCVLWTLQLRVETGERIVRYSLFRMQSPVAVVTQCVNRLSEHSSEKGLCNYGSTGMSFVIATAIVGRGPPVLLEEKCGREDQRSCFLWVIFRCCQYVTASVL
jgi:hypothetical protein